MRDIFFYHLVFLHREAFENFHVDVHRGAQRINVHLVSSLVDCLTNLLIFLTCAIFADFMDCAWCRNF